MKKYLKVFYIIMFSVVALQAAESQEDDVTVLPADEASYHFTPASETQGETPSEETTASSEATNR